MMGHTHMKSLKNKFLLALTPLLLCGCAGSSLTSSSGGVGSSEEEFITTGDSVIDAFLKQLNKYTDHPNRADVVVTTDNYYMMAGSDEYMSMHVVDEFDITRYKLDANGDITVRNGIYTVEDSASKYTSQIYASENSIYCLTDYEGKDDVDLKQTIAYNKDSLEDSLAINFSYKEEENLRYLASYNDGVNATGEYELPDTLPETGEFKYSYAIYAYQDGYLNQKISHDVTVEVENNVVVSSKCVVESDLFGGTRKKVNYSVSTTETKYTQGEYDWYADEVFDPSDFAENE